LQSSHSAYGEDNKIYSLEEIIDQFRMFDPDKKDDNVDIRRIFRMVTKIQRTKSRAF
jgi:hypothetical protein